MQSISARQPQPLRYNAYDQNAALLCAAKIYDVTLGSPSLVSTVALTFDADGVYIGSFTPVDGKDYLIISGVFTTTGYITPDTNYAPQADCYHVGDPGSQHLLFNYGLYSQDSALNVAANINRIFPASPPFTDFVVMAHVFMGVYFGDYAGVNGESYVVEKAVYTDNTFDVVDTSYAPGSDDFQAYDDQSTNPGEDNVTEDVDYKIHGTPYTGTRNTVTNIIQAATLKGPNLTGRLKGNAL